MSVNDAIIHSTYKSGLNSAIKISVIVPAYNAESWIKQCIKSICGQTYHNLEIIAIDDGSTDMTGTILDELSESDSRIRVIHQNNKGLVKTREVGISLATGNYTGFVDADDLIKPDMYERLLQNALEYHADISHCGIEFLYPDGNKEEHYGTGKVVVQNNFQGQRDLLEGTVIEPTLCNKLYRTSLLYDSCLDESILNNEDLLRNFVLFQRSNKSVFEDFCGYMYIQHEGSMSGDRKRGTQIEQNIFRARLLIAKNASEDIRPYAIRTWISSVVSSYNQMMYSTDARLQKYCTWCRDFLKKHKEYIASLIPRQQVAAYAILFIPDVHKKVYSLYQKARGRR